MPDTSLVSVIMRTQARPVLLERAIKSVLAQTYRQWELLIVNDGGSPDDISAIVDLHGSPPSDARIQVFHNELSEGAEAASNRGIRNAIGEYVIIHDDDDSWHPSFLSTCVAALASAPSSVEGVITRSTAIHENIVDGQVSEVQRLPFNGTLLAVSLFQMAIANQYPPISFLYRRAVHDSIGLYREDLPVLGDWEFNLRFLQHFDIAVVPKLLAFYHLRTELSAGAYSNSVIGKKSQHALFDALIRNELLRRDMKRGQFGIGVIAGIAKKIEDLRVDQTRLGLMISELLALERFERRDVD